jgi:DNA-binding FadR family transcriptional regulator
MDADTSIDALVVEVNAGILPSLVNIENAIELRHVLEVGAIRHAAIRRNNSDIEALQQVLDASDNKLAEGQSIIDEDVMFHKTIVASTQNSLLVRVVNWFYEFSNERRARYFADFEISQISHSEHQLIFDGLRNGDPDKCAALLGDHLQHTTRLWSAILTESEELSS